MWIYFFYNGIYLTNPIIIYILFKKIYKNIYHQNIISKTLLRKNWKFLAISM